jgi:hypothetical protein
MLAGWCLLVLLTNPYREPARAILEQHCGQCHRADQPTANPKALAVYNLNEIDFSSKMTSIQLDDALTRLREALEVDRKDVATFEKFVQAERWRRHAR